MRRKILTLLFIITASCAYAQDTVRKIVHSGIIRANANGAPADTNRVVHDENGNLLQYYQYQKLLNTGEYSLRTRVQRKPGDPQIPPPLNAPATLVKTGPGEAKRIYELLRPNIAIKSDLLREGNKLDLSPFMNEFGKEEFDGKKALVLIFWESTCNPCVENLAALDDYFKQLPNTGDMMVIAVSRDGQQRINVITLQKQMSLIHFVGGSVGEGVNDFYQLHKYPSYVVADKDLVIRFAITGLVPVAMPVMKDTLKRLLSN